MLNHGLDQGSVQNGSGSDRSSRLICGKPSAKAFLEGYRILLEIFTILGGMSVNCALACFVMRLMPLWLQINFQSHALGQPHLQLKYFEILNEILHIICIALCPQNLRLKWALGLVQTGLNWSLSVTVLSSKWEDCNWWLPEIAVTVTTGSVLISYSPVQLQVFFSPMDWTFKH
jgi:hypothetical protein